MSEQKKIFQNLPSQNSVDIKRCEQLFHSYLMEVKKYHSLKFRRQFEANLINAEVISEKEFIANNMDSLFAIFPSLCVMGLSAEYCSAVIELSLGGQLKYIKNNRRAISKLDMQTLSGIVSKHGQFLNGVLGQQWNQHHLVDNKNLLMLKSNYLVSVGIGLEVEDYQLALNFYIPNAIFT
jgi:hypothetical protein